jgi:hypothetical protein
MTEREFRESLDRLSACLDAIQRALSMAGKQVQAVGGYVESMKKGLEAKENGR